MRKFRDKIRNRFDVSVAEVGEQDILQRAVFGVAVVSSDSKVCDSVLTEIAGVAELSEDAVLTDRKMELVPFGELYGGYDG